MVHQKIKKSQSSLGLVIFSIIFCMAIFYGGFKWIESNAEESGRPIDAIYNDSFTNLQTEQETLSSTIQGMRNGAANLTEADASFGSAWNGLKGLANIFKLPLNLVSVGWQTVQVTLSPLTSLFPSWAMPLIEIGIVAFIILIIIAIFKGDSKIIN